MNGGLGRILKQAVMASLRHYFSICLEGLRKTVRITSLQAEI